MDCRGTKRWRGCFLRGKKYFRFVLKEGVANKVKRLWDWTPTIILAGSGRPQKIVGGELANEPSVGGAGSGKTISISS